MAGASTINILGLPNTVFMSNAAIPSDQWIWDNTFKEHCWFNTFGDDACSNTFNAYCFNNTIGYYCKSNILNQNCSNNTFENSFERNILGYNCYSNIFGSNCNSNTFGDSCTSNIFGSYCYSNIFGPNCDSNTFGDSCTSNIFGYDCNSNTFGANCNSNTFGDGCDSNIFGNYCNSNTFGDNYDSNTFGNSCYSNIFGNDCDYNTFGNNCNYNTFGDNCDLNTFGSSCYANTFGNDCYSNIFGYLDNNNRIGNIYYSTLENNIQYINLVAPTNYGLSYTILDSVQGTFNNYLTITMNPTYASTSAKVPETYVGYKSDGTLRTWVLADSEDANNKVTTISSSSTDVQYPSAKAVYDELVDKEDTSNKVTSLSSSSTDTEYPSAKAVYDALAGVTPTVIYTGHCSYSMGSVAQSVALDDSKTYADVIADIEADKNVILHIEDVDMDAYDFVYTGKQDLFNEPPLANEISYSFTYNTTANNGYIKAIISDSIQLGTWIYPEVTDNKVTFLSSSNTNTQYPSAKVVYDNLVDKLKYILVTPIGGAWDSAEGTYSCTISAADYTKVNNAWSTDDFCVKTTINFPGANSTNIPVSFTLFKALTTTFENVEYYVFNAHYTGSTELDLEFADYDSFIFCISRAGAAGAAHSCLGFVHQGTTETDVINIINTRLANYVDLTTNQSINGTKTFNSRPLSADIYTKIAYLQSDYNGTTVTNYAYIKTGVRRGADWTNKLTTELDGYFNVSQALGFCGYDSGGQLGQVNGKWGVETATSSVDCIGVENRAVVKQVIDLTTAKDTLYINNTQIAQRATGTVSTYSTNFDYPIFVAATSGGYTYRPAALTLYRFKMYNDSDVLIRDFVPARTSSGQIGLLDIVNNVFYLKEGDGTFTAGADTSETVVISNPLLTAGDVAPVALSNDYNDLINKPTIPSTGRLNTNNSTALTPNSSEAFTSNIALHKIAKTGTYADLLNKPSDGSATIASVANDIVTLKAGVTQSTLTIGNSSGTDITLAKVAKTGAYSDLSGIPTIDNRVVIKCILDLTTWSNFLNIWNNATQIAAPLDFTYSDNYIAGLDSDYRAKLLDIYSNSKEGILQVYDPSENAYFEYSLSARGPMRSNQYLEFWGCGVTISKTSNDYPVRFNIAILLDISNNDPPVDGIGVGYEIPGGLISSSNVTGLATVATTGSYNDLSNLPSYTASNLAASKTITALTQTNGVISATAANIAIDSTQTTRQSNNDVTIAASDALPIFDASDSNKLKGSLIFDGSTINQFLSKKGTWEAVAAQTAIIYTGTLSENPATGTNLYQITLDNNKTYADIVADITAGRTDIKLIINSYDNAITDEYTYTATTSDTGSIISIFTCVVTLNVNNSFQTASGQTIWIDHFGGSFFEAAFNVNWPILQSKTTLATGAGVPGALVQFAEDGHLVNGPELGDDTTTFLRNDGQWATPPTITVDSALSTTSENPVQNKVIDAALKTKVDLTSNQTIGGEKTFTERPRVSLEVTLPSGYTQLDYIKGDGTAYINTGKKYNTSNTVFLDFRQVNTSNYRIWGTFGQQSYVGPNVSMTYSNGWMVRQETVANQQRGVGLPAIDTKRHSVWIQSNGHVIFDGTDYGASAGWAANYQFNFNAYLFTINPGGTTPTTTFNGEIYHYRVWDNNGALIQDMYPVRYTSGSTTTYGMYDIVGNTYYPNANSSGAFTPGSTDILNSTILVESDLAPVALSGSYNDLTNKPTIPTVGILNTNNPDAQSVSSSESFGNTIKLHKVSKTGSFSDLLNKPSYTASGLATSKTITALTQTDGTVSLTAADIAITSTQVSSGTTATIASSDTLAIFDADDNKLKSSLAFNSTHGNQFLRKDGTWASTPATTVGSLSVSSTGQGIPSSAESFTGNITLHNVAKTGSFSDLLNKPSATISGLATSKTLTALTQTDGTISATAADIAITSTQVTAASTAATIATGDTLIIADSSNSNKLAKTSITFNVNQQKSQNFLCENGTWVDVNTVIPAPMQFKGTVGGSHGTYSWETLPSASSENIGWTLKVLEAHTGFPTCEVGDTIISDGTMWVVIPSGDEPSGTVTSVALSEGSGITITGGPITTSGVITVAHGNTSDVADTTNTGRTYIQNIDFDEFGHVLSTTSATETVVIPSNNITGSGTSGYIAKFDGNNTITNGPLMGTDTSTFLRNDGSWVTPTDTKVTQVAVPTHPEPLPYGNELSILVSYGDAVGDETSYVRKSALKYNYASGALTTTGTINGYTLNAASAKAVDSSISDSSTSTNLPTSQAVASFVEGKGYVTTNTTYTFVGGTNQFTVTPSGGSAQVVTITPSIPMDTVVSDSSTNAVQNSAIYAALPKVMRFI